MAEPNTLFRVLAAGVPSGPLAVVAPPGASESDVLPYVRRACPTGAADSVRVKRVEDGVFDFDVALDVPHSHVHEGARASVRSVKGKVRIWGDEVVDRVDVILGVQVLRMVAVHAAETLKARPRMNPRTTLHLIEINAAAARSDAFPGARLFVSRFDGEGSRDWQ